MTFSNYKVQYGISKSRLDAFTIDNKCLGNDEKGRMYGNEILKILLVALAFLVIRLLSFSSPWILE